MNKKIINIAILCCIIIAVAIAAVIPFSYWKSGGFAKKTNLKKAVIFKDYKMVQSAEIAPKFTTFGSQLPWYDIAQQNYAFPDPPCLNQFWKQGDCGRFDDWIEKMDFASNLAIIKLHNDKFNEIQKEIDGMSIDKTQTDCKKIPEYEKILGLMEEQQKEKYETTKEELVINKKSCQNPRVIRILTDEVKELLAGKRKELSDEEIKKHIAFCEEQIDKKIQNFTEQCNWVERKDCVPGHYPVGKCIDRTGAGKFVPMSDELKSYLEDAKIAKKINWWVEPKTDAQANPSPAAINPD
jgi:hypothetical protein